MSVVLFTENFPPVPGGIARFLHELCVHLPCHVEVVTTVAGSNAKESGYHITRVCSSSRIIRGLPTLQVWGSLAAALIRHKPEVCLLGHAQGAQLALPFRLAKLFGTHYGIMAYAKEVRDLSEVSGVRRMLSDAVYRHADFVLAVSHFTRDLLEKTGVDPSKIHVLQPGVSPEFLRTPDARDTTRRELGLGGHFVLGTVARLARRKGHEVVLRSLARLVRSEPNVRYLIVGDGAERRRLQRLSEKLGISNLVRFLGHVDAAQLPGIYDAMDVFVMPSQPTENPYDVEGFGIVFLEAAARSTPSIASPVGGVPEAVVDGETGLLVPPTPEALSDAIIRLKQDEQMRSDMGRRACDRVNAEFTWPVVAQRFANIAGLSDMR